MFFQSIYQMITAGTDLNINIRKVDNSLSVAVMPRRNSLKEDTRQEHGAVSSERNTGRTGYGFPADHTPTDTESAGTACQCGEFPRNRQKRQRHKPNHPRLQQYRPNQRKPGKNGKRWKSSSRRLMMQPPQKRFSEAMTWLKQARILTSAEKQKEIDAKMQEVQKLASEGSLFGMAEEAAPIISQPQGSMNGQPQPGIQTSIFPEQQTHTMNPEPVMQPVPQQIAQQLPLETPQPVYDMNRAHMQSGPNAQAIQEGVRSTWRNNAALSTATGLPA